MLRTVTMGACLLAAGAASAALDVRGSWQVNLDCGGYATATTFFDLDQNLTTGEVIPLPQPQCGTIAFLGAPVAVLESCTASGESGLVSGSSFAMPDVGYATSEQILENPVYFGLANCVVTRIVATSQHTGTIIDDGAGTAVRIVGSLTNGSVQMYSGSSLCFDLTGPFTFCSYDMRRNDVAAGSAVTVQPNERVSVTFDGVSTGGTASVTPLNDPAAEIPADFQLLGGVLPIFYDVSTTAAITGPITTCYAYDDANDDGTVDGTSLPETSLQLLHEEEEVFVDRTSSIDTVENVICAETGSLSQLVPGAPTIAAPPPPPGNPDDVPVSGIKMLLKRNDDGKEKGVFITRDQDAISPPVPNGPNDPRTAGATFEVVSAAEGLATFSLPPAGWIMTPSGVYKFNGKLVGGPVLKAVIKPGKNVTVKTTDTGLPLAGPQGTVSVRFTTGDIRHCARFGPTTIVRDEPNRFSAKGALAAALLNCSGPSLGLASPSGAFVD